MDKILHINDLTDDQLRGAINLADTYTGWIKDSQALAKGRLRWKRSGETQYLYRMQRGSDTGISLGPRSPHTEQLFDEGKLLEGRIAQAEKNLLVKGRIYRALNLPLIDSFAAHVLRELDLAGLLGHSIRVVGSGALPAYELEANSCFPKSLLATEDFDMAWVGRKGNTTTPGSILAALKNADATWTVVEERGFQLRNRDGQMIDIVMAPELANDYPAREKLRALPTEGQEYLLGGIPVSQVVSDARGNAARIVAPDPRLFALHKFYLAEKPDRALKRAKDIAQAEALMDLIESHMPHYALDDKFQSSLPAELGEQMQQWKDRQAGLRREGLGRQTRP